MFVPRLHAGCKHLPPRALKRQISESPAELRSHVMAYSNMSRGKQKKQDQVLGAGFPVRIS